MKRLLLFFVFLIPFFVFGQVLRMNAWYMPDTSTNFPQTMPTYSLIFVGNNDTLYSVTSSYTSSDNMHDVITDGNYVAYPSGSGGDSSYFYLTEYPFNGSERITTKSDITSMQADTVIADGVFRVGGTYLKDGQLWRNTSIEYFSQAGDIRLQSSNGSGDQIEFKGGSTIYAIMNGSNGNFTFGDNTTADSSVDVHGGMEVDTDILVGGGWAAWVPTFTWTGGTPTVSNGVYRYHVINNTVYMTIKFRATNSSGSPTTDMSMTVPHTPADVNTFAPMNEYTIVNSSTFGRDWGTYVDCADATPANRKLYTAGSVSIPDGDYYDIVIEGFYEITGK